MLGVTIRSSTPLADEIERYNSSVNEIDSSSRSLVDSMSVSGSSSSENGPWTSVYGTSKDENERERSMLSGLVQTRTVNR